MNFKLLKDCDLVTDDMSEIKKMAVFSALKSYTDAQILEAYTEHFKHSPFQMKVCDVVNYWEHKLMLDDAGKSARAEMFLNALDSGFSVAYDYLCADTIAVKAFILAFGGVRGYGVISQYTERAERLKFSKIYAITAKPMNDTLNAHIIPGIYHRGEGTFKVIGDVSHELISEYQSAYPKMRKYEKIQRPALTLKKRDDGFVSPDQVKSLLNFLVSHTRVNKNV